MVGSGNILVFDNGVRRGASRVLEVNPHTGAVEWEYSADPPESFYTYEKGSAQRLPNGNTLICDGDNGRAFEVTPEGETVWEWLNPALRKGRRVQLYRIERIPPDRIEPLLE
jgi:outer membrane protein assembly factor BamB